MRLVKNRKGGNSLFTIWRLVREVKFAKYSHSYNVLIILDIEMFPTKVK